MLPVQVPAQLWHTACVDQERKVVRHCSKGLRTSGGRLSRVCFGQLAQVVVLLAAGYCNKFAEFTFSVAHAGLHNLGSLREEGKAAQHQLWNLHTLLMEMCRQIREHSVLEDKLSPDEWGKYKLMHPA